MDADLLLYLGLGLGALGGITGVIIVIRSIRRLR